MFLIAAIAAAATPQQARASVRIVKAQRVTREEWGRSRLRREIIVDESGRKVTVRLMEFE